MMIVLGADAHKSPHTIAAVGASTGELLSDTIARVVAEYRFRGGAAVSTCAFRCSSGARVCGWPARRLEFVERA